MENKKISANDEIYLAQEETNETEEITLASDDTIFEQAIEIANTTETDEKFNFILTYNPNQKEELISVIQKAGAIEVLDNEEKHYLTVQMNMTQLKLIKSLDGVERVKTDEGLNTKLKKKAFSKEKNIKPDKKGVKVAIVAEPTVVMALAVDTSIATIAETPTTMSTMTTLISDTSSCCCPSNTKMENAKETSDESYTSGCICCPGAEQWFKFTATRTGQYTILTTGSLDTIGTLYDCCGNQLTEVDDYAPCGKINFRIIRSLTAGTSYYVKVRLHGNDTGSYTLRITDRVLANYVTINKNTITLEKGVLYELPTTSNYTYKGYLGAQRIPGFAVSLSPSNANEQKIWWWEQYGDVLECSYGWDDDGDRYIHVTATGIGTAKLYAQDWNENGKRDECTISVNSMLIYRTRNRERLGFNDSSDNNDITPITAEDLTYGGKSTQTLISNGTSISMSDLNNYDSISQRVTIIKNFFQSGVHYDETYRNVLFEMIDHFVDGTGTDYSNAALTAAVQSHSRTLSYVNAVIELVKSYISEHKTTINNFAYDEDLWTQPLQRSSHPLVNAMNTAINNGTKELFLPYYGENSDNMLLLLAIHGFYGNKIMLKDFENIGNTYSGSLEFTFYDHFGLDTPDLTEKRILNLTAGMYPGFRQWYILQHWDELEGLVQPKPFVTNVTFSVPISGTYE